MTTATSSSDRYDAARAALADFDARTAKLDSTVETTMERRMADALRALITPPAVESIPDAEETQRIYTTAYYRLEKIGGSVADTEAAHAAAREALYQAGIQASWESWEPENAPGLPSGTAEQLAVESEDVIERIKASRDASTMDEVFEARDDAEGILYRWIMFTKEAGE